MRPQPKRVLHVIRAMARAGAETWLMHALRRLDGKRIRLDFLVHTDQPCAFDEEIESRGCRIFRVCNPLHSFAYGHAVTRILRENAFDAVHSHVHHFSGYLMMLARMAGTHLRIAHSHNDTSHLDRAATQVRRGYLHLMKRWIRSHATRTVGVSRRAGESLFGAGWLRDPRSRLLYCGVDLAPFRTLPSRHEVREELGLESDDLVIGHVGRFDPQKNHGFLLDVTAQIMARRPNSRLLLVGEGPLRQAAEERVRALGVGGRVTFAGVRSDVPRMLAAMDVFLFPSHHEGLPLSLIEAQAAGLPCVISDAIAEETDVNVQSIERLSLLDSPARWAEAVLQAGTAGAQPPAHSLHTIENSPFDIRRSVEGLYELYGA